MSAAAYLAPPSAPPHDPLRLLLSADEGWRDAGTGITQDISVPQDSGALALAVITPAAPGLLDPLGIMGGLVPPPYAAMAPGGELYLLDRTGKRLLWFDACTCSFAALPCLSPAGPADPRNLKQPTAIAAGVSALVVSDGTDGGTVVVLNRRDLAPRLVLQRDWLPGPVALDMDGRIYVADRKHGAVHRFSAAGQWLARLDDVGLVNGLALDRHGRLYVISDDMVRRFTTNGSPLDEPSDIAAIRDDFAPLPFQVDASGRLVLAALCRAAGSKPPGSGVFDTDGTALNTTPVPWPPAVYPKTGRFLTNALDSHISTCVWHRIVLDIDLPSQTRLSVRARTDEIEMPIDLVAPADDPAWSAAQVWRGPASGVVECLFTTPPGRYLWLELTLTGDGSATPRIADAMIEFPRIPLRRYLPAVFGPDPVSGELADRFLALFDQNFRSIESRIDDEAALFDPRSTPESLLAWLAGWVGLTFPGGLGAAEKRRLLRNAPRLYAARGTVDGLRDTLLLYLGLDRVIDAQRNHKPKRCAWGPTCPPDLDPPVALPKIVLEHWRLRRWLFLGQGRLGETSRLWGEAILNRSRLDSNMQLGVTQIKLERDPLRDPFHAEAHAFSVFLPASRARKPVQRRRIEALIRREAPAHTLPVVHWVGPGMKLGIRAMLGFDTVIGMQPPPPLALDKAKLGRATVLQRDTPPRPGVIAQPSTRLGFGTRLG
jgi:phage tail-like protein